MKQRIAVMSLAFVLGAGWMSSCTRDPQEPRPSAAPVPTHVVTEEDSGRTIAAEQGDSVEVRLAEPSLRGPWRLSGQSGDARLEPQGGSGLVDEGNYRVRVFRFRALQAGEAKITFTLDTPSDAPESRRVVTFRITVR